MWLYSIGPVPRRHHQLMAGSLARPNVSWSLGAMRVCTLHKSTEKLEITPSATLTCEPYRPQKKTIETAC